MSENEKTFAAETAEAAKESPASNKPVKNKFITKDLVKCVVVLVAIALVAGALLGVVNWLTYVDPDAAVMAEVASFYGVDVSQISKNPDMLLNVDGSKSSVNAVYEAKDAQGALAGYAFFVTGSGAYSGTVDFVVYVQDGKISKITVYTSSETASIGGKVLAESNLAGLNGLELSSVTDYSAVDTADASLSGIYISGATKSTKSVMNAVRAVAYAYNTFKGGND